MHGKRIGLAAAILLTLVPVADARVKGSAVTGSVGDEVSLTVTVSPAATCRISVVYKSGPSHAQGLGPKHGSRITWTWMIGKHTTFGTWPVKVDCGKAGVLNTHLRVSR